MQGPCIRTIVSVPRFCSIGEGILRGFGQLMLSDAACGRMLVLGRAVLLCFKKGRGCQVPPSGPSCDVEFCSPTPQKTGGRPQKCVATCLAVQVPQGRQHSAGQWMVMGP